MGTMTSLTPHSVTLGRRRRGATAATLAARLGAALAQSVALGMVLGMVLGGALALPSPAEAQTRVIDRTGPNGGTIAGTVTRDGRLIERDIARTGPNGGTFQRSTDCRVGWVSGCRGSASGVTPDGRAFSRQGAGVRTPYRAAGRAVTTGPQGTRSTVRARGPRGRVFGRRRF
ncbi:MAG: hypothetical protein AAF677_14690 [Pseudomonadota bacterium]